MAFTTIYKSDFYHIEADKAGNMMRSEWLRHVNHEELVEGATKLYEALHQTNIEYAIANGQNLGAISAESKDWLANEFYELLSQTSLKKMARITPSILFHQLALESVITRAEALGKTRFIVKNFSDPEEAAQWILS